MSKGKRIVPVLMDIQRVRASGYVQRFHTTRTLHRQTLAEHQWQCAMLLQCLFPDIRPRVLKEMLVHDMPEFVTGDVPAPAKWRSSLLAEALDKMEHELVHEDNFFGVLFNKQYQGSFGGDLSLEEKLIVSIVDSLELVLFALDEYDLGNVCLMPMIPKVLDGYFVRHSGVAELIEEQPGLKEFIEVMRVRYHDAIRMSPRAASMHDFGR